MLEIKKATKFDKIEIRPIYNEAFPIEERAPFKIIYERHLQRRADLLVLKDDKKTVGLVYNVIGKDCVYLFYLAISKEYRGQGYGSKTLQLIKEFYPNQNIFLARESLHEPCDNLNQRLLRHQFYLKNGFKDLDCLITEGTVTYEVMSTNGEVTSKQYEDLINAWRYPFTNDQFLMVLTQKDS